MKEFKWVFNRFKSMNIKELIWRIEQKSFQIIEYKQYYKLHKPIVDIPMKKESCMLVPKIDKLHINWDNKNYTLFEDINLFSLFKYELYKKKWNAGFQTEKKWPIDDFSYKIIIGQREDIGDIRTNWELNRHFQFVGLAKNFFLTSEKKYIDEFKELFNDWNHKNLFLHGVQWTSAMEVAIRIVSWIYCYAFVEKAYREKEELRDKDLLYKLECGIKIMVHYVLKHRARYSSANNHLIVEMFGVGMGGIFFGYDKWINYSIKVLTKELSRQNSKDGVNREMSLHYQTFIMEAYGLLYLLMKKNNIEVPIIWRKYLFNMSKFVADCCGDYGEVIVFGDNDEGKILDFTGKMEDHYRYVLQLMGVALEQRFTKMALIENLYWLIDEKDIQRYKKKDIYKSTDKEIYHEGGYTILRSKDHKVLVGFDHAELGYGSIAAHGHADALSVQVFYEGNPIFIDPGTYNYHVPSKARDRYRSTKYHNTVYIEGVEQSEILGPFLWGNRSQTEIVGVDHDMITAETRYHGIEHRRTCSLTSDGNLIILDRINGCKGKKVYQQFLLPSKISIKYSSKEIELHNGEQIIDIKSNAPQHCVEQIVYSVHYGEQKKGNKLCFMSNNTDDFVEIKTKIIINKRLKNEKSSS